MMLKVKGPKSLRRWVMFTCKMVRRKTKDLTRGNRLLKHTFFKEKAVAGVKILIFN